MPTPTSQPLRLVFAGTPDFAARHLDALIGGEHRLVGVYTQPDRPRGRGKKAQASPVKQRALDADLPVFQPESLKDDAAQRQLAELEPDLMVVVAYGLILPRAVLETPRLGCVNVHASLLPRWRGAAPIQRAIEAGDTETGITIMQMDTGLDTGDMLLRRACPIGPTETAGELHDRLAELGPPALEEALAQLAEGSAEPHAQDETLANYAPKITKAEAALDWHRPAEALARQIRAFNPFPVCHARLAGESTPIRLWRAEASAEPSTARPGTVLAAGPTRLEVACGGGRLAISHLQLPGKKVMAVADLLRGRADLFREGSQFELPEFGK